MRGRTLANLAVSVAAAGCAVASRSSETPRNFIDRTEIATTRASTAWDAVQQLRPDFLRGRAVASNNRVSTETPIVFLDDTRLGELDQLRTIPASIVLSIQLISASDATTRWGTGYPAGVIEVRTRS